MSEPLFFFVPGHPEPCGSKRALPYRGRPGAHPVVVDDNPNAEQWKKVVAGYACKAIGDARGKRSHKFPIASPLHVTFVFYRVRPRRHFKPDGFLRDDAPLFPMSKPDALKLARGCEDALTGVIYVDDSQIVSERLVKVWGDVEGVDIEVEPLASSFVVSCGGKLCGEKESTDAS